MSVFDQLKSENAKILSTINKLEDTFASEAEKREELMDEAKRFIQTRNMVEENYLYPLLIMEDETQELAILSREEIREIENVLEELENMDTNLKQFEYSVETLHGHLSEHIEREEEDLYHQASLVIDDEQEELLEKQVSQAISNLESRFQ
ncbi:MAG: hypothetical protein GF372_11895 [Candidatus Marinimicrobia bacterium]|nr:hypothetical protein [Candidatus Neomarinimicrobiota bacterium]